MRFIVCALSNCDSSLNVFIELACQVFSSVNLKRDNTERLSHISDLSETDATLHNHLNVHRHSVWSRDFSIGGEKSSMSFAEAPLETGPQRSDLDANQRMAVGWWDWICMVVLRSGDTPEYFWAFLTANEIALESCRQVTWRLRDTQVPFFFIFWESH